MSTGGVLIMQIVVEMEVQREAFTGFNVAHGNIGSWIVGKVRGHEFFDCGFAIDKNLLNRLVSLHKAQSIIHHNYNPRGLGGEKVGTVTHQKSHPPEETHHMLPDDELCHLTPQVEA